jgi:hypothetical protein
MEPIRHVALGPVIVCRLFQQTQICSELQKNDLFFGISIRQLLDKFVRNSRFTVNSSWISLSRALSEIIWFSIRQLICYLAAWLLGCFNALLQTKYLLPHGAHCSLLIDKCRLSLRKLFDTTNELFFFLLKHLPQIRYLALRPSEIRRICRQLFVFLGDAALKRLPLGIGISSYK